jgi:hypothetical protein
MWHSANVAVVAAVHAWLSVQVLIRECTGRLATQWQGLAQILANKPLTYQLVLQEGDNTGAAVTAASKVALGAAAGKPCLDAELLLRARRCMMAEQPAQACESLLLLLERGLMKEQLAAGLIKQDSAGGGSSSGSAAGAGSASGASSGGAAPAAEVDPWGKVRPLPPGESDLSTMPCFGCFCVQQQSADGVSLMVLLWALTLFTPGTTS